mgnify:CR=1 FL=1|jgi:SAM-dependent methyltransferase
MEPMGTRSTSVDVSAADLDARANHEWLLGEFLDLLKAQEPQSVLDVGCGAGQLLKFCASEGMAAFGIDQPGPRLETLGEEGFDVREGGAYELPFEDKSMDWVTMRHVPHHLEQPGRAFKEALRVARSGVLLAEPSFDLSLSSQRGALALDCWEKRLDREGGMVHAEVLDLGALLAEMPAGFGAHWEVQAQRSLRLTERSISFFEGRSQMRLADLAVDDPERAILADLLAQLHELGLSWNGSLCVCLRRRRGL